MRTNPKLAAQLVAFQIDRGGPELRFAQRLARENLWPLPFAMRVVHEYFRFIYLVCVSEHAVTPSVAVDQAWHLHLCYTRSYWIDLCEGVVGRPLHHGPTQGGRLEDARYHEQYERTLHRYELEFGEPAPVDIWPAAERRFAPDTAPFWITQDRYLVVDKSWLKRIALALGVTGLGVLGAGASASGSVAVAVFLLLVVGFIVWKVARHKKDGRGNNGSGCGGAAGCGGDSGCGGGGCGGD